MDTQPQDDPRHVLTSRSIEKIEMAYLKAVRRGDPDPVVLALDLSDPLGLEIADRLGGGDRARRMLAGPWPKDVTPLVVVGLPAPVAGRVAEDLIPGLSGAIGAMNPGEGFLAITVADGGARLTALPPVSP